MSEPTLDEIMASNLCGSCRAEWANANAGDDVTFCDNCGGFALNAIEQDDAREADLARAKERTNPTTMSDLQEAATPEPTAADVVRCIDQLVQKDELLTYQQCSVVPALMSVGVITATQAIKMLGSMRSLAIVAKRYGAAAKAEELLAEIQAARKATEQ